LLITMCFLAVMLIVFGSVMYWISTNATITERNNQYNMSLAAAEAATEKVLSQMTYDYISQSITNNGNFYGQTYIPNSTDMTQWPVKYTFSDTNGNTGQISVNLGASMSNSIPLYCQYTGLYGIVQPCTITAIATPVGQPNNVPATVTESLQFASIPLFQFAIFYNMNLEIDPGVAMGIKGAVWSNGGIWSGSANASYSATVSAVGTVYYGSSATSDPFCGNKTDSGTPIGNFSILPSSGNDRITMPVGTNNDPAAVEAIINIPPADYALNTAAAFTTNGQVYLANAADLYVTNASNGTNWGSCIPYGTNLWVYYQDANFSVSSLVTLTNYQTFVPFDFFIFTNRSGKTTFITNAFTSKTSTNLNNITNIYYAGYTFLANVSFVDYREGGGSAYKTVQAVQIDVGKFNAWLANTNYNTNGTVGTTNINGGQYFNATCTNSNHKSHPIDSIYVYNSVPLTSTTLPAVRVANGTMLPPLTAPKGFTVATAQPMYVLGSYNAKTPSGSSLSQNSTKYTYPASLMADAITILSGSWSDTSTANYSSRTVPTTTTVNAAMLEGIVQSTNSSYSGGVENFLRLLENWSSGSVSLYYNGSINVMFPSQYATNYWNGNYYSIPTRKWAFDTNFTVQAGLPPLTPQCKGVIRASWGTSQ